MSKKNKVLVFVATRYNPLAAFVMGNTIFSFAFGSEEARKIELPILSEVESVSIYSGIFYFLKLELK